MEEKDASYNSLSCIDKNVINTQIDSSDKESIRGRILVRVRRRRSRSPAEAILLTENVTQIKRAKIGDSEKDKINENEDKLPIKIFRFTATLSNDETERNTEELVSKMLSKTTKEIEIAKTKSATTPSSEKKSIKNLKANAAASPSIGTDKNKLLSSIKKSAEARYRMVQTKRDTNDLISDEAHDKNIEQSNNIDKELKSLYQLYDLELEESESNSNNRKQRPKDDIITCNGVQSEELQLKETINAKENDFVYDLYCHITQEHSLLPNPLSNLSSKLSGNQNEVTYNKSLEEKSAEMPPLPDFQSAFGHVTTNIVGCDWKSVQDYLASDLSDGMPDWWHRGGDIDAEYGSNFDDSDDSNAEDNWRNEYPDELDEFDDDDIYGFKDEDDALDYDDDGFGFDDGDVFGLVDGEEHEFQNIRSENDIYGFDTLRIQDEELLENSSDGNDEQLLYTLEEDSEFRDSSNRHGLAYAKYKRKMQRLAGEIDDDDDENTDDSSDDCYEDAL